MKNLVNNMEDYDITKDSKLKEFVIAVMKDVTDFTDRKITDTPTDNLSVVNRKYVNLNGTTRPTSSTLGQFFLDMNLASGRGKGIWWNGTGWVDATGTYV